MVIDPLGVVAAVRDQGWAVVELLGADRVEQLRAGHRELAPWPPSGCRPSTVSSDERYRMGARDLVRSVIREPLSGVLPDHRSVVAAFVAKASGPDTAMAFHRDWSTCDESRFVPVALWLPLAAAGAEQGALGVVPGSHREAPVARGSGMPVVAGGAGGQVLPAEAVVLDVPAGSAVLYHPALVHGSGPNRGPEPRVAAVATLQPAGAPLLHYRRRPDSTVAVYEVEPDFYVSNPQPDEPVRGRLIEVLA